MALFIMCGVMLIFFSGMYILFWLFKPVLLLLIYLIKSLALCFFAYIYYLEVYILIMHVSHPVNKVYMGGVNLRLSVNCLYD